MIVIIAEKPSMARAIKEGLGTAAEKYVVTNAFGHILEQAEPDAYTPDDVPRTAKGKKKWRMQDLPIIPGQGRWKMVPKKEAKDQLGKIIGLLKGADGVINAGDPDREGQLLIDEILEYAGYQGRVQRVWLASLDATSVQKAFAKLEDNSKYHPLRDAAQARSEADWLVGMNFTRMMTILSGDLYSIGRVQTPTLALVVRRDRDIESFKPRGYFEVIAYCSHPNGAFIAKWQPAQNDGSGFDEEGRLIDRQLAESIAAKARGHGQVKTFEAKDQKQAAPLPFSLSALQKVASAKYGLSAGDVLSIAQSLYEKKFTSYPRSDCRYLPEEQFGDAGRILKGLPIPQDLRSLVDPVRHHSAWNTGKITAHHAMIPTGEPARGLAPDEEKIYDLIWKSYVALFLPDYRYRAISAVIDLGVEIWKSTGRQDIDAGWKTLYGVDGSDEDDEEPSAIPVMRSGDAVEGQKGEVQAKRTKPPARFTDGTLIDAMSNIHKFVTDPEAKKKLKETSGLGTEATRANILDNLVEKGYIERKGKQVLSTQKGRALVGRLELSREAGGMPEMVDPVTTALWEDRLSDVAEAKISMEKFTAGIERMVAYYVDTLRTAKGIEGGAAARQTAACPICGGEWIVTRYQSKRKKSVFFWICNHKIDEQPVHPLLADEHGKPGTPFGDREDKNSPEGPECPHCPGQKTQIRQTKSNNDYFRCSKCQAAFSPDDANPDSIGKEWLKPGQGGRAKSRAGHKKKPLASRRRSGT